MPSGSISEHIVECFWPDLRDDDVATVDRRALAAVAELAANGDDVTYIGSLVMREDEVLLCRFAGSTDAVRRAAERAGIPFERIVEASSRPAREDASER